MRDDHGESNSELQLFTYNSERFHSHLISTDLSGSARRSYGNILEKFGIATGIRTLIAEPQGLFNRGGIVITKLTNCSEAAQSGGQSIPPLQLG